MCTHWNERFQPNLRHNIRFLPMAGSHFHGWSSTQPGSLHTPLQRKYTQSCSLFSRGTTVWTMGHGCVQVPGCVERHPWFFWVIHVISIHHNCSVKWWHLNKCVLISLIANIALRKCDGSELTTVFMEMIAVEIPRLGCNVTEIWSDVTAAFV